MDQPRECCVSVAIGRINNDVSMRRLVLDCRIVVDLIGIRSTACHGIVLGIRFVADMCAIRCHVVPLPLTRWTDRKTWGYVDSGSMFISQAISEIWHVIKIL